MLDISKPLTGAKVQSYYRAEYSSASNSYFTQGGTLRGEWHGQLAAALGLSGEVTGEAFDRLAEGQHPQTGEQLIKHRDTIRPKPAKKWPSGRMGSDLQCSEDREPDRAGRRGRAGARGASIRGPRRARETEKYVQARMGGNSGREHRQMDSGDVRARYGAARWTAIRRRTCTRTWSSST